MHLRFRAIAAAIALFSLTGLAQLSQAHSLPSDSGIFGPKYADLLAQMDALAAQYPEVVTVINYGVTPKNNPLRMVLVKKHGSFMDGSRPALLMTGSTHGNEYLNIEDRLPGALLAKAQNPGPVREFLDMGGVFIFVPIVNPDGYIARTRDNSHNVDLNRDWNVPPAGYYEGFKEIETRALATKIAELKMTYGLNFKMTLDYHCCIGALLYPWSYEGAPKMDGAAFQMHKEVGDLMLQHLKVDVGTTGDVLGYYPLGTTKDYYFSTYGAAAFTYEGSFRDESKLFDKHLAWWEGIAGWANAKVVAPFLASLTHKRHPFPLFAD